jgi:hypothetical protein
MKVIVVVQSALIRRSTGLEELPTGPAVNSAISSVGAAGERSAQLPSGSPKAQRSTDARTEQAATSDLPNDGEIVER